jgi:DHA2 family multidrug resistance protein
MDAYTREEQGKAMAMWGVGTMLGPISGPTLGGWLTDEYSWRWVFYINLPVGIVCAIGLMILVKNKASDNPRPFDLLGFSLLSIAIGTFQLMLDRGEQIDWFSSKEIIVEATVAGVAAVMFVLHMLTDDHPFLPRDLFRDRNLVLGLSFTAVTGLLMIVTATLLPPFLQQLKNYPVFTTGIVMAPRGIGTMISMFVVSRMIGRVDARWLIALGLSLCGVSLYDMTLFTLDVSEGRIIWNGFLQGIGLGLVFPPLTTLAFATVPARIRTEGAAINALMRNLGASIGVATLVALLDRNIQINRSTLAEYLTPFSPLWRFATTPIEHGIPVDRSRIVGYMTPFGGGYPFGSVPTDDPSRLIFMWGEELNRQAATIAYLNDFRVLAVATMVFVPLLFFMRRQAMLARPSRR